MTPLPHRLWIALLALAVIALAVSLVLERRVHPTVEQAVAHERTEVASLAAAKADTVVLHDTVRVTVARVAYRSLRDTLRLSDTLAVIRTLASADTVIVRDSVAFADAGRSIEAHKAVESSLRTELAIALQPHPRPRLGTTVTVLYDPINAVPLASVSLGLRVIGNVSLIGTAFQKLAIGEKPRAFFGVSVRL